MARNRLPGRPLFTGGREEPQVALLGTALRRAKSASLCLPARRSVPSRRFFTGRATRRGRRQYQCDTMCILVLGGDSVSLVLRICCVANGQNALTDSAEPVLGGGVSECDARTQRVLLLNSTVVEPGAFENCFTLLSVELPDGLTSIGKSAFSHCCVLSEVRVPGSVSTIAEKAFFGCERLQNIQLGDGVGRIESQAFANCGPVGFPIMVDIPSSVTYIAQDAFDRNQNTSRRECVYIRTPVNSYAYRWAKEHEGNVQIWN